VQVVHQKTAAALAVTAVKNEDKHDFSKIVESVKASFNDRYDEARRSWGGGIMGVKSQSKTRLREKQVAKELGARK
jgi:large subunit ribosomal protein L7Ae